MKKLIFCLPVFIMLASCAHLFESNVQVKFDLQTFNEQRQLWQESNVQNYQYQFTAKGFRSYDGTVFVSDGEFMLDRPSDNQRYANIDFFKGEYTTIDETYKRIERLFNAYNNKKFSKADFYFTEIFVEYDTVNHIPIKIAYIFKPSKYIMVDGTFYFEITDFRVSEGTLLGRGSGLSYVSARAAAMNDIRDQFVAILRDINSPSFSNEQYAINYLSEREEFSRLISSMDLSKAVVVNKWENPDDT